MCSISHKSPEVEAAQCPAAVKWIRSVGTPRRSVLFGLRKADHSATGHHAREPRAHQATYVKEVHHERTITHGSVGVRFPEESGS